MSHGWCANLSASPLGVPGPGRVKRAEDGRRIAFHIRFSFNRASSLLARCWLLVEGETENPRVINELARQCGHHFDAEGIKVIEFAQSGLKTAGEVRPPYGESSGMSPWKATKRGKICRDGSAPLNNDREEEREHLTALPALAAEHFALVRFCRCFSPGCAARLMCR